MGVLRRLLGVSSVRASLLIDVEDLPWTDPASSALPAELARDIPNRRCLLLSTARPGALPPWRPGVLTLDALPQSGARSLIEATFGAPVEGGLVDTILARTGGNPFF